MATWETQYLNLLSNVLQHGEDRVDRTGTGTRALFGQRLDLNLKEGFPLITTKKMAVKSITAELLWFLEGSSDERRLAEIQYGTLEAATGKRTIWSDNAEADYWKHKAEFEGDLGRVYGVQWRRWGQQADPLHNRGTDQIAQLVDKIKHTPSDRRLIVSAWNVAELNQMALPPCHMMFQCYVSNARELSMQVYMRSADFCLGVPYNVASYAMLTHMLAHVTGCTVGRLILDLGDTHVYKDHIDLAHKQLERTSLRSPKLWLDPNVKGIDNFTMASITVNGYESYEAIPYKMST